MIRVIVLLILLFTIFYIIFKKLYSENFVNNTHYSNININKPTIIIGSSEFINEHINDLKRLKKTGKYQFICHQSSWGFFEEKLNFYPDYLSMYDIEIPNKIKNYDEIFVKKNLVKLLFYDCWNDYNKIRYLDTGVIKNKSKDEYNEYFKTKLNINNKITIPTEYIGLNETKNSFWSYKCPNINKNNPKLNNKLLIYSCGKYIKDKLSLHVLPLIIFLKIKNVYIMGFDCRGGRWNRSDSRLSSGCKKNQLNYTLPPLIKEIKNNKLNVYNLIKNKNTELHPYIEYKNIKELN
jgi:hypothetical protein